MSMDYHTNRYIVLTPAAPKVERIMRGKDWSTRHTVCRRGQRVRRGSNHIMFDGYTADKWMGRADFLGFVFKLPNGDEACGLGLPLIWANPNHPSCYSMVRSSGYTTPLRPIAVEVER